MDISENEELDEQAEKVTKHEEAICVIEDYEKIIRFKKKGIINIAFRQERIFKWFKDSERFEGTVELNVSCWTVYFKLNPLELFEKYPKLKKSTLTWDF